MASFTGTFTTAGQTSSTILIKAGETLSLELDGAFTGEIHLELAGKGLAQWSLVRSFTAATTTVTIPNETLVQKYFRFRVVSFAGGPTDWTLEDAAQDALEEVYDEDGELLYWVDDEGFFRAEAFKKFDGTVIAPGSVAADSITNTEINSAAGIVYSKLNLTGGIVNADVNASAGIVYSKLSLTGGIVNADVSGSAAIAYSKLALTGSIVNADVSGSAAIAYSKLNLTGGIVNADVNASAAIAYSKLNLSTSIVNADISGSAAIAYSKLNLATSIVNADIAVAAAIARTKIASGTASHVVINDGSGVLSSEATLATTRGGLNIASYTTGDTIYASSSSVLSKLAIGSAGQVLTVSGGLPSWATPTAPAEGITSTATSAGTVTLTSSSNTQQRFTGTTFGQIVSLGDATTYSNGKKYSVLNSSTQMISVTNNGGTSLIRLGPGAAGVFILADNSTANGTWVVENLNENNASTVVNIVDDFISHSTGVSASNPWGETNWEEVSSGTGSGADITQANVTTANHPGVIQLTKGTTAGGRVSLWKGGDSSYFGSGLAVIEYLVFITTLSDGTNTYNFRVGWGDDNVGGDHVDGVYFEYNSTTSANWIIKTANNSTRTATTSSTAVATGWHRLRIEVGPTAARADFFVDGTNIGNVTTNIPTTAARASSPCIKVVGSAGTSARVFLLDYYSESWYFSTSRG